MSWKLASIRTFHRRGGTEGEVAQHDPVNDAERLSRCELTTCVGSRDVDLLDGRRAIGGTRRGWPDGDLEPIGAVVKGLMELGAVKPRLDDAFADFENLGARRSELWVGGDAGLTLWLKVERNEVLLARRDPQANGNLQIIEQSIPIQVGAVVWSNACNGQFCRRWFLRTLEGDLFGDPASLDRDAADDHTPGS